MRKFGRLFFREKAQGVVEYAVLLAFVVILLIGLMLNNTGTVKSEVSNTFEKSASIFSN